jgi:hypothetical protein
VEGKRGCRLWRVGSLLSSRGLVAAGRQFAGGVWRVVRSPRHSAWIGAARSRRASVQSLVSKSAADAWVDSNFRDRRHEALARLQ